MKEMGRVIASDEKNAEILVMRESACGGHCDKCASSCNQTVTIITKNDAQVSPGEIVEIEAGSSCILYYAVCSIFKKKSLVVTARLIS